MKQFFKKEDQFQGQDKRYLYFIRFSYIQYSMYIYREGEGVWYASLTFDTNNVAYTRIPHPIHYKTIKMIM